MDCWLIIEVWIQMQEWYKDAVEHPPPTCIVIINHMTEEQVRMYRHVPFLGQTIFVGGNPFPIDYSSLKDEEIILVVRRLHLSCLGGLLGIWAEHLLQWLNEATLEEESDATYWQKVVAIFQA